VSEPPERVNGGHDVVGVDDAPSTRERLVRLTSRGTRRTKPTPVELLGVVGVGVGFGLLVGPAGVVVALAVALLWYAFSGVYGFAAGQFVVAAVSPARLSLDLLSAELVAVEAALVLMLTGGMFRTGGFERRSRRLFEAAGITVLLGGVVLAVGIGSASVADRTLVVVAVGAVVVVVATALYVWGRLVVSPVADESPLETDCDRGVEPRDAEPEPEKRPTDERARERDGQLPWAVRGDSRAVER
jgi:hypothetical protein